MTATPDTDDSWAEFYREIGLEPEPPEAPASPPTLFDESEPTAELEATEADNDDEDDGAEESAEADSPPGEEELNEDGSKKRRRRRRRRSKKKGPAGPGEPVAEGESGEVETEEPLAEVYDDDGGPSPEASRELIANWDVPSWTEIVAGLHRPSGR